MPLPFPVKSRTWSLSTSANGTYFNVEFDQIYADLVHLQSKSQSIALLSDTKAPSTAAQNVTSGSFGQRDLTQIDSDPDSIVTLLANQFTLQSGDYLIEAQLPAQATAQHQGLLYNVSDSNDESYGSTEFTGSGDSVTTRSRIQARVVIASAKTFEIRHRAAGVGQPGGVPSGWADEVYTTVKITKIG